jgi:hypothetical protein
MKRFIDSSVLVESCLSTSPKFGTADALVNDAHAVTSAHGLRIMFLSLSVFLNHSDGGGQIFTCHTNFEKGLNH